MPGVGGPEGSGDAVAVSNGVAIALGAGAGSRVATGVGEAGAGVDVARGCGVEVREGVGTTVGSALGVDVGTGVCVGSAVGASVGEGVGSSGSGLGSPRGSWHPGSVGSSSHFFGASVSADAKTQLSSRHIHSPPAAADCVLRRGPRANTRPSTMAERVFNGTTPAK